MPPYRSLVLALVLVTPAALAGCFGLFSCDGSGPAIAEASGTLGRGDMFLEMNVTLENGTSLVGNIEWTPEVSRSAGAADGVALRMDGREDPDGDHRAEVEQSACQEWENVPAGTHDVEAFYFETKSQDEQTGSPATPPKPIDVNVTFQTIS